VSLIVEQKGVDGRWRKKPAVSVHAFQAVNR